MPFPPKPPGGKKSPPRKIANTADVKAAGAAVSKVPPKLQGKAKARVMAAARAIGPEALDALKPGKKKGPPFPPKGGA